ncbi:gamma-glutamyltranspeptidase Ggt1 [Schizosaccharomyces japonicus yFS275]|uniref:Glutathione hydrolase n=1 Tax=Schizosaccharomyces japonicus (strain yFS275 / FY16936) TaxID=402676 RepID=B6JYF1_SCHJY|nr:gamma-glutamyltranspeptidase Ggt1 [Schizosaccharomyces japonicus yFS275]EEB06569.1 gamma-glutamyltranspeptidase Ggt1 [Schizosaccharomyces japonicus yFS275]
MHHTEHNSQPAKGVQQKLQSSNSAAKKLGKNDVRTASTSTQQVRVLNWMKFIAVFLGAFTSVAWYKLGGFEGIFGSGKKTSHFLQKLQQVEDQGIWSSLSSILWPSSSNSLDINGTNLVPLTFEDPIRYRNKGNQQLTVSGRNGIVAAEAEECSQVGVDILREGGNAVDAAIAAGICIGAVNSFSSGIGGGGFMLVRLPNGTSTTFNFREKAPAAAHKDMFKNDPLAAQIGGLSVAVPGELAGYESAWRMYGSLPWRKLFEPTIKLMRDGMPMPVELASRIRWPQFEYFKTDPVWGKVFAPKGRFLRAGERFTRPELAYTLEEVATHGIDTFYRGDIARQLVNFVQKNGGILTMEDMANYTVRIEEPLRASFDGREVLTCGRPCSGEALVLGLNVLDRMDLSVGEGILHADDPMTDVGVHRLIETMKWISAGRTILGDPLDIDNSALVNHILSSEYADSVRANISDERTYDYTHYNAIYDVPDQHGTTHLSVIDKDGMAVALTATINLMFGSQLMEPKTGIVLNDHMDDFSLPGVVNFFGLSPSPFNFIAPGKRPQSSAAPTIVVNNGDVEMVLGASGGSRISTAVLDTLVKKYRWNRSLRDSVESPRYHHQLLPSIVYIDETVEPEVVKVLEKFGHVVDYVPVQFPFSEIQAVYREEGMLYGISDSRKQAVAAAF